ncbi:class I SAM-dependent methyltransferase [Desulfosporosinus meridiei]|uniref:Methylase involved in ubiquinone/menaquinone biosynthesis n=1 Tax=Desulfosporosinus meridiei (strain ATCC BAA-275 / DSM 13257 / KCTC 12902 / NCIMB 13706 / S10) TaxID=768704 RepID=J7ITJ7_DESMD|nr:class I SAM-dependent methyltransferase [Desulfosporosinus meridiei]AFQ45197.1 methylase involved in ubiquinone/menaquinone biosynthesis [Desulfosporosinus meridiei DSM 13257]
MDYTYLDCLASFGVGGAHPGGLKLTKGLLSREYIDQEKSILDVGCGTGQTSAYIAEKYRCSVTSLDCNTTMLLKAKQRFSSLQLPINVVYGSAENLPFINESFDFILSESVTSFTNVPLTIMEFKRVLKTKGVLLAIEMVLEDSLSKEDLITMVEFYGVSQLLTQSEWYNLFHKAGFNEITVEIFKSEFDEKENDIDSASDFLLSENIDDQLLEIFEKHEHLSKKYGDRLSFCIFRCSV